MIRLRFLLSVALAAIAILVPNLCQAQEKPQSNAPPTQNREEIVKRINRAIEENVVKVLERIEITEGQIKPMQSALVKYFAPVQMERIKMQAERQKMRQEGGGPPQGGGNRQAMIARMAKLDKLRSELDKSVKGILDKAQIKQFRKAMDEVAPAQRRGGGRR